MLKLLLDPIVVRFKVSLRLRIEFLNLVDKRRKGMVPVGRWRVVQSAHHHGRIEPHLSWVHLLNVDGRVERDRTAETVLTGAEWRGTARRF